MIGHVFLGRYEAKRLLGEGGMGRVYLARQYDPDRYVVVKVMHEDLCHDRKFMERFERETRTMAKFQHPHSVALLDSALDDPLGPCIVMEYIKGVTLDQLLVKNKRFTPARVARLVGQLCEVLQCAHDLGIVHRDLKPANLMVVDADTPDEQIKVMDFGLAKVADALATQTPTDTSAEFAIGSPKYIAPEQIRGETVDPRGDLYSVGVIAYEMLAGRLPFERAVQMDMILAHATEAPPTFAELGLRSWVPESVERVVLACLEKEPDRRPQSARQLADQFNAALVEPNAVTPPDVDAESEAQTVPVDPAAVVFEFDAWMPQRVAIVKLRGFVHDHDGEVMDSEPGLIRVRLGTRPRRPQKSTGLSALLGLTRRDPDAPIGQHMELRLLSRDLQRENRLHVTVVFHPPDDTAPDDVQWRERCVKLFCDARAYLMGNNDA